MLAAQASQGKGCSWTLLRWLPNLKVLDDAQVSDELRAKVTETPVVITSKAVRDACRMSASYNPETCGNNWWRYVEGVTLNNGRLQSLQNIQKYARPAPVRRCVAHVALTWLRRLRHLRSASFANNELVDVDALRKCTEVQTLSLAENLLTSVRGLAPLTLITVRAPACARACS